MNTVTNPGLTTMLIMYNLYLWTLLGNVILYHVNYTSPINIGAPKYTKPGTLNDFGGTYGSITVVQYVVKFIDVTNMLKGYLENSLDSVYIHIMMNYITCCLVNT